jgi:two-component system, chemotaxis family, chemotaxis protein CheY
MKFDENVRSILPSDAALSSARFCEHPIMKNTGSEVRVPKDEPNPSLSRLKILVVDDSGAVRMMLTALLHTFGINHIVECSDGAEALRTLEKSSFDLVLTDVSMRPMDGLEFARQLRRPDSSGQPSLPVLFLSNHSEKAVVKAALEAGGSDYLEKPISRTELLDKIVSLVGNPRPLVQGHAYWGPDRRRKRRLASSARKS